MGNLERARGHVQEGDSALVPFERETRQEIVLLLFEQLFVEGDSGGHKFGDPPLDELLGEFRVLKLVAHGDLVAGPDEFGKIDVKGMVREAGHRDVTLVSVRLPGLDYPEDLAHQDGIVRVRLVEVSHPVEQYRFRVLRLDREELLDERSVL